MYHLLHLFKYIAEYYLQIHKYWHIVSMAIFRSTSANTVTPLTSINWHPRGWWSRFYRPDALDGFSMSIGQNSSPMMRYALVRGSHSCPTLFAAVVCPSLAICTVPTLTRPLPCSTGLNFGSSWWLETEDWSFQTILAKNGGGWPATNEPRTGDV